MDTTLINNELERLHKLLSTEHKDWAKEKIDFIYSNAFQYKIFVPKGTEVYPPF